jgi:hypothetical protein
VRRKIIFTILTKFGALKRNNNESIFDFIKIFNKTYSKILVDVKPSEPTAKVTFAGAFDPYFSLLLRKEGLELYPI